MLSFENWSVKRSESSRTKLTMKLWNNVSWVIAVKMTPNWLTIRPADFNSLFLPNNIILSSIQSANEATDPFGVISVNCFVTGPNYNCNSLTCKNKLLAAAMTLVAIQKLCSSGAIVEATCWCLEMGSDKLPKLYWGIKFYYLSVRNDRMMCSASLLMCTSSGNSRAFLWSMILP